MSHRTLLGMTHRDYHSGTMIFTCLPSGLKCSIFDGVDWVDSWAAAIVAEPWSRDIITSRLNNLLEGKSVNGAPGKLPTQRSKNMLQAFVSMAVWKIKPEAFDAIWHAVFDIAKKRGWKASMIRDATYYWTAHFLLEPAWDSESDAEEEDDGDSYDDNWIATAFGDARLFSLGYAYSPFAMSALLDGLGWEDERNSDSMRMGSCAQLLSAGQRIKLHVEGGGNNYKTPGLGGTYLQAQPSSERDQWKKAGTWEAFLKALDDEQAKAGPRDAVLLKARLNVEISTASLRLKFQSLFARLFRFGDGPTLPMTVSEQ